LLDTVVAPLILLPASRRPAWLPVSLTLPPRVLPGQFAAPSPPIRTNPVLLVTVTLPFTVVAQTVTPADPLAVSEPLIVELETYKMAPGDTVTEPPTVASMMHVDPDVTKTDEGVLLIVVLH
jgi:hypothetical protein